MKRYLIIGGAGFIGSNFVEHLINQKNYVIVYDNLLSGKKEFISHHFSNRNFEYIEDNVGNWEKYKTRFGEIDILIHLASNADM